jgi:phosphoribulokinase
VTGSSGAGTTSVRRTFEQIFHRERIEAAYIEGDAFNPTAPLAAIRPKR